MSNQKKAKKEQEYVGRFIPNVCGNCVHYKSDFIKIIAEYDGSTYNEEKNKRCSIGEFAVKKNGSCKNWSGK